MTEAELAEFLRADRWQDAKGHIWILYGIARAYGAYLRRPILGLEIGTREGNTTIPLLAGLVAGHPDSILVSVDNDTDVGGRVSVAQERVKQYGLEKNWQFFLADSHAWTPPHPEYDFIFIDGDHEYGSVLMDFQMATEHLRQHGLILLHDAEPHGAGDVWKFTRERCLGWNAVVLPFYHGLAIYRRESDWDDHGHMPHDDSGTWT